MPINHNDITCLGIIAGSGTLPWYITDYCDTHHISYVMMAFDHVTYDRDLNQYDHLLMPVGKAQLAIDYTKKHHVSHIMMAGAVKRPSIAQLRPDAAALKMLAKSGFNAGDDGILRSILNYIEKDIGYQIIAIQDFIDELLIDTHIFPNKPAPFALHDDIKKGITILDSLSQFDIGQSLVIKESLVLAIEAIEGTNMMIERAGLLHQSISDGHISNHNNMSDGAILIKTAKLKQSQYADMPVIGPKTLEMLVKYNFSGLVIRKRQALIIDAPLCCDIVNQHNLFVHYENDI